MASNPPLLDEVPSTQHLSAARRSPHGSRNNSPCPERSVNIQVPQDPGLKRGQSPCLPRKTIEELETEEHKRKKGTVDPDDPPLRTAWTFWFERAPASGSPDDYSQALKNIYTVHTIKQFFSVYNNLKAPSLLRPKECYHLMRACGKQHTTEDTARKPLWEDPQNSNGGIWVFKCRKDMTVAIWLELLLAAIGEQFLESTAEGDDVVGISIKVREHDTDTIQIWNENASQNESSKVIDRVRTIIPYLDIRDYYYSSIKDKLSGNRAPFYPGPSSSQQQPYRDSPSPQAALISSNPPRHSFNPQFTSYRFSTPPRGAGGSGGSGGFKRGPEGYFRHHSPRHSAPSNAVQPQL